MFPVGPKGASNSLISSFVVPGPNRDTNKTFMIDPSTRPDIPKFSVHSTMEVKLGIM
jgi:hypothetical protein